MFVLKPTETLKEKLQEKGLAKLILPKLAQAMTNLIQLGPRVVVRSAIKLVRVNPLTRFLSVLSLVVIDLYLFVRGKISPTQLAINLIYSASMFVGSTAGWYLGQGVATQLAFDFILALALSLVFTVLGIKVFNVVTQKWIVKYFTSDVQKGLDLANEYLGLANLSQAPDPDQLQLTKAQALEVFRSYPKHPQYIRRHILNVTSQG